MSFHVTNNIATFWPHTYPVDILDLNTEKRLYKRIKELSHTIYPCLFSHCTHILYNICVILRELIMESLSFSVRVIWRLHIYRCGKIELMSYEAKELGECC